MDECRVEANAVRRFLLARRRFTLLDLHRSALLARHWSASEIRHEYPEDEHYPYERYTAKPDHRHPERYPPALPALDTFRVRGRWSLCRRGVGSGFGNSFLVARRCASYPGAAVTVVPFSRLAKLGPPAAFVVLHHQLLALCIELLVADDPGVVLTLQLGVATVRFPEIYLTPSEIHRAFSLIFFPLSCRLRTPRHR